MSLADELRELLEKEERWEIIFNKINGEYVLELCKEVKDECAGGGIVGKQIQKLYQARDRVADRLGVDPVIDADFHQMTEALEEYARTCGKLIYHYGYQDGVKGI